MKPGKILNLCLAAYWVFAASCSHTGIAKAGPKPSVEKNGQIPAVMASLRAKEITKLKVISWSEPKIEKIGEETWWVANLGCTFVNDLFGPQTTEVKALIRDDKVVRWLYSGSKEEVQ